MQPLLILLIGAAAYFLLVKKTPVDGEIISGTQEPLIGLSPIVSPLPPTQPGGGTTPTFIPDDRPFIMTDEQRIASETGLAINRVRLLLSQGFSEAEMDVHLTDKLKTELLGIFNWALDGYKRLRKNNYIFSKGTSMQNSKQQYKNQSNSVFAFISHYFEKTEEDSGVMLKKTYELYESFCNSEGEKDILTKPEFKRILISSGYKIDNSSKHSNAVCVFGVKIKEG